MKTTIYKRLVQTALLFIMTFSMSSVAHGAICYVEVDSPCGEYVMATVTLTTSPLDVMLEPEDDFFDPCGALYEPEFADLISYSDGFAKNSYYSYSYKRFLSSDNLYTREYADIAEVNNFGTCSMDSFEAGIYDLFIPFGE